jgi:Kef-type K+ transport system membrane component KefB
MAVAAITKIDGTRLLAIVFLEDKNTSFRFGIGVTSRDEVGFVVAQVALFADVHTYNVYTMVVIMAADALSPSIPSS